MVRLVLVELRVPGFMVALQDDGVEEIRVAELYAVVSGAFVFDFVALQLVVGGGVALGLVFVALVLQERGEDIFGYEAVGFSAVKIAG